MRAGAPGRGASVNRSSTPRSFKSMFCHAAQRFRHRRTVSTLTDNSCAIVALLLPCEASSTICARNTSCCPLLRRFVTWSNAARSSSCNWTGVARFGISFPLVFLCSSLYIPHFHDIPALLNGVCTDWVNKQQERSKSGASILRLDEHLPLFRPRHDCRDDILGTGS